MAIGTDLNLLAQAANINQVEEPVILPQAPQVIGRRGLPQPSGVGNIFAQEPAVPVVGQPEIQAPIVQQAGQGTVLKQAPMSEQFTQMGIQQGGFIPQQLGESVAAPTSPQANFEARMATGLPLTEQEIGQAQQFATSMGTTFDPQAGYSREPFLAQQAAQTPPPITQPTGAPTVDGVPVMEWIKGGRQLDPQGRFIPEGFETREQALEAQGIQIPERTQTTSVGLQGTRGPETYGGLTKSQLRDMVGGGDRLKQAMAWAETGRDPITGRPMEQPKQKTAQEIETERLELQKLTQEVEAGAQPNATPLQKKRGELAEALKSGIITQNQYDDQLKRQVLGNPPLGYDSWAEYENRTGIDADGDGEVASEAEADAAKPTTDEAARRARLEELRKKKAGN